MQRFYFKSFSSFKNLIFHFQSTDDKNENKSEENKVNEENKLNVEEKLNEENKKNDDNKLKEENKVNGTKIVDQQENGTTKNGKDMDIVDNM